jgi:hypothetical protein
MSYNRFQIVLPVPSLEGRDLAGKGWERKGSRGLW